MKLENIFYTYDYLREDNTSYYVGKGKNNRAYNKINHKTHGIYTPLIERKRKQLRKKILKLKKEKGNNLQTSPVLIIRLNKEFNSIKEAAQFINGDTLAITRCLNKRDQYSHIGYTFKRI